MAFLVFTAVWLTLGILGMFLMLMYSVSMILHFAKFYRRHRIHEITFRGTKLRHHFFTMPLIANEFFSFVLNSFIA